MSNKILIAVDTSENAMKAVKYAAEQLGNESKVTLFHVFFKTPLLEFQEDEILQHHYLSFSGSSKDFKDWLMTQKLAAEDSLDKAKNILIEAGLPPENIEIRIEERKTGVAADILNKVKEGGYDTLIIGRRGMSRAKRFFTGSVTAKIMDHAQDCTVWIVV